VQTDTRVSESNAEEPPPLPHALLSLADSSFSFQSAQSLQVPLSPSAALTSLPSPTQQSAGASSVASQFSLPLPPSTVALPPRTEATQATTTELKAAPLAKEEPLERALDLIRRGSHPLERYPVNGLAQVPYTTCMSSMHAMSQC
jgi:hypothetical protein